MMRIVCLLAAALPAASGITVVERGKSPYTIVLPADAIPSEKRAAEELQRFLGEMSGARLPVATAPVTGRRIVLEPAAMGGEEFRLQIRGQDLAIAGGRPRGILYGVYTLLDRLGCRWYTREVSRIPRTPTIRFDRLDERGKPAFEYREPFFTEAWDKDWAARNRTNGNRQQLDESTGGRVRYHPFVHSFNEILPPDRYFADHPEYYSLIDGKRRRERSQLCLTNPEVLRLTVEKVREWIRAYPDATIFSVSQNDWEGWCECGACRQVEQEEGGEHSGPLLRFVNAVAEEIGKTAPGKLIDTLAYWYTENPPARVRPRPNVRIRLCPIGVCESHPYETCPRSAYFVRNLKAWSRITSQLYIWHYNTNFAHYLLPFPDFDQTAATVPLYARNGVVGIFFEGSYPPGGGGHFAELRSWVLARQLWDTRTNVDAAVTEFLGGVYGKAARAMRGWFDLQQREARQGRHLWIFNVPDFSPEFVTRAAALFREAESAADTEAIRSRVRHARLSLDYYELLLARRCELLGNTYGPRDAGAVRDRWQTLARALRGFGMQSIHEGRNLDVDDRDYAAVRTYDTLPLENGRWRADVVPALGGRVVRLVDKRTGRELMRRTSPGESGYPNIGGAAVSLHADYQARAWPLKWGPGRAEAGQVRLSATAENGLAVTRTVRLADSGLTDAIVVESRGGAPVPAVVRASIDFDPGDVDRAAVRFGRAGGGETVRPLIRVEEQPTGSEMWSGAALPAGEWRLEPAGSVARFDPLGVERAALSWTAKGPYRATFGMWSKPAVVAPGVPLRLNVEYGVY
jgi:hypothetical protein